MKKTIFLSIMIFFLCSCSSEPFKIDPDKINVMDLETETIDEELHSLEYLVIDMSDLDFLYSYNSDLRMYPASLTKLVTLDTVLSLCEDLDAYSYVTYDQVEALIDEDASLAYIQRDYPYTIRDLLYGLILPSGADAALALENYFGSKGIDLVKEMNARMEELGAADTHFVNTTGLHEDDHYTTLDDLYLVVMDLLKSEEARKILNSIDYVMEDGTEVHTTIGLARRDLDFIVLGGKTGYTPEAGQNIIALCKDKGKSYLIMTGNAYGKYALNQYWHYDDVVKIIKYINTK